MQQANNTQVAAVAAKTKSFTTKDGTNYIYDYSPAAKETLPTFLLLHGYPSSRHDWRHQVTALVQHGYGVLAPDLLGMGDSDKPTNLEAYRSKRISGHLKKLMDHESVSQVIGVGHDWGSPVLSKMAVWYPERFLGLAFLSSGYFPPGRFFDVDAINRESLGKLGYTQYGYWYFFNSFDAGPLISEKVRLNREHYNSFDTSSLFLVPMMKKQVE